MSHKIDKDVLLMTTTQLRQEVMRLRRIIVPRPTKKNRKFEQLLARGRKLGEKIEKEMASMFNLRGPDNIRFGKSGKK